MSGSGKHNPVVIHVAQAGGGVCHRAIDLQAGWHGHPKPTVVQCGVEQLLDRAQQAQDSGTSHEGLLALVDLSRIATERELDRVLHVLAGHGCAGVVIVHAEMLAHCSTATHASRQGLIVRGHATPSAMVCAMLQTLAEREPAVHALRKELAIMQRVHDRSLNEVQKLHEELHLAAGLQRELAATSVPSIPGFDLGVLHRPVSTVSGDVHCVRAIGPRHVAFFVADAVGHGVPAALMTMVLLSGLAAHMQEREHHAITFSPALVLESLNSKLLAHGFGCERFATAVCGVMDVVMGRVRVAGAGHPPPIVVGKGGTRQLETTGPLLGVFEDAVFDEVETTLARGERLIAYSDGLEGALPRAGTSLLHQLAPLEATLRACDEMSGEAVIEAVAQLLDGQAGSLHQLDDVTVLVMGSGERASGLMAA